MSGRKPVAGQDRDGDRKLSRSARGTDDPRLGTHGRRAWLTITLDDPPANTYSYEMMQELDAAILAARMDAGVHVIVITGAGEKFFCAGANIGMLKDADPTFKYYFCLHANETLNRLEQTPKLVIAALNGHTVGGGLEVAMAADIRIARQGAGKIGMPEVALGVLPGTGGTQRFARLRRQGQGDRADGDRRAARHSRRRTRSAWSIRSWGEAELNGRTFRAGASRTTRRQFTPPQQGREGRRSHQARRAVRPRSRVFAKALALERELQQRLFESDDAKEGLNANLEKRKPNFSGR